VTGCLQAAPDTPTGTAGTADASASKEKFLLRNASSDTSTDAAGATTTPTARSYRLAANEEALAPHVGKKIEVTGTLDGQGDAPRLIVESGKVIAPTCTD